MYVRGLDELLELVEAGFLNEHLVHNDQTFKLSLVQHGKAMVLILEEGVDNLDEGTPPLLLAGGPVILDGALLDVEANRAVGEACDQEAEEA